MNFHDYEITVGDSTVTLKNHLGVEQEGVLGGGNCCVNGRCKRIQSRIKSLAADRLKGDKEFKELGYDLFELLFSSSLMKDHFKTALKQATNQSPPVGIRIRLIVGERCEHPNLGKLAAVPWAVTRKPPTDTSNDFHFGTNDQCIFLHQIGSNESPPFRRDEGRIKVSIVVSYPKNLDPILFEKGVETVRDGLDGERFDVKELYQPTTGSLKEHFSTHKPEIVHFLGHGELRGGEGYIAILHDNGEENWLPPSFFVAYLRSAGALPRLVTLIACEGGAQSSTQAFAGFAPYLAREGVSAVVAMRYEIDNRFAIRFAETFYKNLGDYQPIASAFQQTRMSLAADDTNTWREKATPIYFAYGSSNASIHDIDEPEPIISPRKVSTLRLWASKTQLPRQIEFFGRAKEIDDLCSQLKYGGVSIIHGAGGTGKTALAVESIHQLLRKDQSIPPGILWISCHQSKKRLDALISASLPKAKRNGLVVLDGLDELASPNDHEPVITWLKKEGRAGRILVTTRTLIMGLATTNHPITYTAGLDRDNAERLFRLRAEEAGWSIENEEYRPGERHVRELIHALCDVVGNLPLAIHLLALQASNTSLTKTLEAACCRLDVMMDPASRMEPSRHRSITNCFTPTFDSLSPDSRQLLSKFQAFHYLHAHLIDAYERETRTNNSKNGITISGIDWLRSAEELVSKAVWRSVDEKYTMHPLIRRFAAEYQNNQAPSTLKSFPSKAGANGVKVTNPNLLGITQL